MKIFPKKIISYIFIILYFRAGASLSCSISHSIFFFFQIFLFTYLCKAQLSSGEIKQPMFMHTSVCDLVVFALSEPWNANGATDLTTWVRFNTRMTTATTAAATTAAKTKERTPSSVFVATTGTGRLLLLLLL